VKPFEHEEKNQNDKPLSEHLKCDQKEAPETIDYVNDPDEESDVYQNIWNIQ